MALQILGCGITFPPQTPQLILLGAIFHMLNLAFILFMAALNKSMMLNMMYVFYDSMTFPLS